MLIYRQNWIESERGWGTRPDGCSLHLNLEDVRIFVKRYWDGMPDEVPDEYSRPEGAPYAIDSDRLAPGILDYIKSSRNGLRLWQWEVGKNIDG